MEKEQLNALKAEDAKNDGVAKPESSTSSDGKNTDEKSNFKRFEKIVETLIEENAILRKSQEEMSNKISSLLTNKPNIAKKIKDHFVRLSLYEGKIITAFKGDFYNIWDDKRRTDILSVDLVLQDGKEVKGVDVMKLLNSGRFVEAKILERKTEEESKSSGFVNQREFDGDYGMVEKDVLVEVESIKLNTTFVVELPSGDKLEIDEKYVNIQ